MSRSLDIADAMAARLRQVVSLPGLSIVVWRQQDLKAEIERLTARNGGMAMILVFTGFDNPDGAVLGNATATRRYTLTILAKPVLASPRLPTAAQALELAAQALHNWDIETTHSAAAEIRVTGATLEPDETFLSYVMNLEVTSRL